MGVQIATALESRALTFSSGKRTDRGEQAETPALYNLFTIRIGVVEVFVLATFMQDQKGYTVCAAQAHITQEPTFIAKGWCRTHSTHITADSVNTFSMLFLCKFRWHGITV